ncbi:hypothetical protein D3C81_1240970 [compost metagenome]
MHRFAAAEQREPLGQLRQLGSRFVPEANRHANHRQLRGGLARNAAVPLRPSDMLPQRQSHDRVRHDLNGVLAAKSHVPQQTRRFRIAHGNIVAAPEHRSDQRPEQLAVHRSDALGVNEGWLAEPLCQLDYTQIIRDRLHSRSILQQAAASADQTVAALYSLPYLAKFHPVHGFHAVRPTRPFRIHRQHDRLDIHARGKPFLFESQQDGLKYRLVPAVAKSVIPRQD